jgi:hypothetical protein
MIFNYDIFSYYTYYNPLKYLQLRFLDVFIIIKNTIHKYIHRRSEKGSNLYKAIIVLSYMIVLSLRNKISIIIIINIYNLRISIRTCW